MSIGGEFLLSLFSLLDMAVAKDHRSLFLGISFFYQGMQFFSEEDAEGKEIRLNILRFWLGLYAFVGTQLGWTLRPFFGSPGQFFELFRSRGSNFYISIWDSLRGIGGF